MTKPKSEPISTRQKWHFEGLHDRYAEHYYDRHSTKYRDYFFNRPQFEGIDLQGARVAEIMCGDGALTTYLHRINSGADCVGFDISEAACTAYHEATGFQSHAKDITREPFGDNEFDIVAVSGGLHHVAHFLPETFDHIHRALRTGGILTMFEPNGRYILEFARRIWYRIDNSFDQETEQALDHDAMLKFFGDRFELQRVQRGGGPAFFLVYNSMIFRVPKTLKAMYAPTLTAAEHIWNYIPLPWMHAYFVAQWRKRL